MRVIDLTGKTFGRWSVVKRAENSPQGQAMWLCRCECGNERAMLSILLRRGISRSCGCLHRDDLVKRNTVHGGSVIGNRKAEYNIWSGVIKRCTNPKCRAWKNYGGRGITICDRWRHSFANFLADVGERPSIKHSLDRYPDQNGNYEPGNVRWATAKEQCRNKRNNRLITLNGETRCVAEWADVLGLKASVISNRLHFGATPEQALRPQSHFWGPGSPRTTPQ